MHGRSLVARVAFTKTTCHLTMRWSGP
jgi:hypothetical protein